MSGTSLDGVDLACVEFWEEQGKVNFNWLATQHTKYPNEWEIKLANLTQATAQEFAKVDNDLGAFYGKLISQFRKDNNLHPTLVASHGHTIFHQPQLGFTTQIGHGAQIYAATGLPTICDFRSVDVANGGQGAPLVPIGDKDLFYNYDACINLGGFANISFEKNGSRIGFDIAPCNMGFNKIANALGHPYDDNGKIAASGEVNSSLLHQLNQLPFYLHGGPKSLGVEWFNQYFWPIIQTSDITMPHLMATMVAHTATQIANVINAHSLQKVLITGGGAYNKTLINQLMHLVKAEIVVGSNLLIKFKEALIFAYLGWLRVNNRNTALSSVTGAKTNSVGGALYGYVS